MIPLKRPLRVLTALLVAVLLTVTAFTPAASAIGATTVPTVYVLGFGSEIVAVEGDENSASLYPKAFPDDFANTVLNDMKEPFLKGMLGNWDPFHQYVIQVTNSMLADIALDKNGEVTDGSGRKWKNAEIPDAPGSMAPGEYLFEYDWRRDPFEIADQLNDCIEKLKIATGCEKVNLVGRCLGNNIVLAYLARYGDTSVSRVIFYSAGFDGFEFVTSLFSGKIMLDSSEIQRFMDTCGRDQLSSMDPQTFSLLMFLVKFLNASFVLDVGTLAFNSYFVPEFHQYILPDILRASFATCPGIWSFIGDDEYEHAKRYVFGDEIDEWAGLIEKIDHYHYDVMMKSDELITGLSEKNIPVYVIAKYGLAMMPLTEDDGLSSDGYASVANSSHGATVAKLGDILSPIYLYRQKQKDGGKYLEPAKSVDASTCLLPDHTWFIRDLFHTASPVCMEQMLTDLLNYDGYATVFDFAQYPQYQQYEKETDSLRPLTSDDMRLQIPTPFTLLKLVLRWINQLAVLLNRVLRGM